MLKKKKKEKYLQLQKSYLPLFRGRFGLMLVCLNIIELDDGLSDTSSGWSISILFLLKRNCSLLPSAKNIINNFNIIIKCTRIFLNIKKTLDPQLNTF